MLQGLPPCHDATLPICHVWLAAGGASGMRTVLWLQVCHSRGFPDTNHEFRYARQCATEFARTCAAAKQRHYRACLCLKWTPRFQCRYFITKINDFKMLAAVQIGRRSSISNPLDQWRIPPLGLAETPRSDPAEYCMITPSKQVAFMSSNKLNLTYLHLKNSLYSLILYDSHEGAARGRRGGGRGGGSFTDELCARIMS